MPTAGKGIVLPSGKGAVLSSGKGAVFNAAGECSDCCIEWGNACTYCTYGGDQTPKYMMLTLNDVSVCNLQSKCVGEDVIAAIVSGSHILEQTSPCSWATKELVSECSCAEQPPKTDYYVWYYILLDGDGWIWSVHIGKDADEQWCVGCDEAGDGECWAESIGFFCAYYVPDDPYECEGIDATLDMVLPAGCQYFGQPIDIVSGTIEVASGPP